MDEFRMDTWANFLVDLAAAWRRVTDETRDAWGNFPAVWSEPPAEHVIRSIPAPLLELLCLSDDNVPLFSVEALKFVKRWPLESAMWLWAVSKLETDLVENLVMASPDSPEDRFLVRSLAVLIQLRFIPTFAVEITGGLMEHWQDGRRGHYFISDFLEPSPEAGGDRLLALAEKMRKRPPWVDDASLREWSGAVGKRAGRLRKEDEWGSRAWRRLRALSHEPSGRSTPETVLALREALPTHERTRGHDAPSLDRLREMAPAMLDDSKLRELGMRKPLNPDERRLLGLLLQGIAPADAQHVARVKDAVYIGLLRKAERLARRVA